EVGPAERIDRVRDAALVGEDLLGSERDAGRGLWRHPIGLVVRVRMEGLRPAEDGGERLDRRPDDVDLGLLRGQADAGRLRVESEEPRTRVLRPERVPHLAGPDPAGRAVLRELLEQIVVRVEEEGQARREVVHLESAVDPPADVFHAVRQGEGPPLSGGRPSSATSNARQSRRMASREDTATPQVPNPPFASGSSVSYPYKVGMSNATLRPVSPCAIRYLNRRFVSSALP